LIFRQRFFSGPRRSPYALAAGVQPADSATTLRFHFFSIVAARRALGCPLEHLLGGLVGSGFGAIALANVIEQYIRYELAQHKAAKN